MSERKPDSSSGAPFGTLPRRSSWPLVFWIAVFALWFAFLIWMAVQYPAR